MIIIYYSKIYEVYCQKLCIINHIRTIAYFYITAYKAEQNNIKIC